MDSTSSHTYLIDNYADLVILSLFGLAGGGGGLLGGFWFIDNLTLSERFY